MKPRRCLLYGIQGIGKSTFASKSKKPVFFNFEDGLSDIDCHDSPLLREFPEVLGGLGELYEGDHDHETMVFDGLDRLEGLIWKAVCEEKGVDRIEDIDYGKGYAAAMGRWETLLDYIDNVRNHRNMMVILVAHSQIQRFTPPDKDAYDRYGPNLHKTAAALLQEWCDDVLFVNYQVHTKKEGKGLRERTRGIGKGDRVIFTQERPTHLAKNRCGLPEKMPFTENAFAEYAKYFDPKTRPTNETVNQSETTKKEQPF